MTQIMWLKELVTYIYQKQLASYVWKSQNKEQITNTDGTKFLVLQTYEPTRI